MLKYSSTHQIKFTSISESYGINNKSIRGQLSSLHSSVITYAMKHFDGTRKNKQQLVQIMNILTYALLAAEPLPYNWTPQTPFENLPNIDEERIQAVLGDYYLTIDGIDWDLQITEGISAVNVSATKEPVPASVVAGVPQTQKFAIAPFSKEYKTQVKPETEITDLYIQPPEVPQFDINRPWIQGTVGSDKLAIYTTLPEIPKRQRDISITTDINKLSETDLMHLFPTRFIKTRAAAMYTPLTNVDFDDQLGIILPIEGYTKEQCIENIIKYPHFYKLARYNEDWTENHGFKSLYSYVEIEGKLYPTMEVWDNSPISKVLPRQAEFVKEYVTRKYIMDRDIKGIEYKYPLYGELNPFLTLFMPAVEYVKRGYDPLELAKKCVESRIAFKQSRSPILRRLNSV